MGKDGSNWWTWKRLKLRNIKNIAFLSTVLSRMYNYGFCHLLLYMGLNHSNLNLFPGPLHIWVFFFKSFDSKTEISSFSEQIFFDISPVFMPYNKCILYQMTYSRYELFVLCYFYFAMDVVQWFLCYNISDIMSYSLSNLNWFHRYYKAWWFPTPGHSSYWCWMWYCPHISRGCISLELLASKNPLASVPPRSWN